jgi:hypothetical protein
MEGIILFLPISNMKTHTPNLNKLLSDKIVLVRADNGILITDTTKGENGTKVYEIINEDGSVDFDSLGFMFIDIAEYMNIPLSCDVSGLELVHMVIDIEEANELFDDEEDE